jgi:hypothetical protein
VVIQEDPQDPEDEDGRSGINRGVLIGSMGALAALVLGGFVYLHGTFREAVSSDWLEKVIGDTCPICNSTNGAAELFTIFIFFYLDLSSWSWLLLPS